MNDIRNVESTHEVVGHLSELKLGESAVIGKINEACEIGIRQRLLDLGFVPGAYVSVQNMSPMGDPIAYSIHETLIALRNCDSQFVQILKKSKDIDE